MCRFCSKKESLLKGDFYSTGSVFFVEMTLKLFTAIGCLSYIYKSMLSLVIVCYSLLMHCFETFSYEVVKSGINTGSCVF